MATSGERENLASLVADFERHGSQIAVVAPRGLRQNKTSYSDLAKLARHFGAELFKRRIAKGERVLLWGENSAEWVAAFFGCVMRGVLPVPLDAAGSWDFAARVVAEVSPRLILAADEKLQTSSFSVPSLAFEHLSESIILQQTGAIENLAPQDPLQIIFTSGTTGDPKGVVHTHANVLASLAPIEREMQKYLKYERPFHPIRFLHTLPLSHVFGQFMGLWIPPLMAAEVHYQSRLVASEIVAQISRDRISVLAAVPRVLDLMQADMQARFPDLPARIAKAEGSKAWQRWWRFGDVHRLLGWKFWAFVSGGASLSAAGEQFWNALGFVVVQGYGMTETTALVSLNHPFRPAQGTIGKVLPGREIRLTDEGEVLVRGETVSNTVWQGGKVRQEESDWLRTGDLAELDASGNLHFRGRKKDLIVTSAGLNIHPEDLEAALSRQSGVKVSTVIESDRGAGPEPVAVLVMVNGADPQEAVSAANLQLAGFQRMRRWLVWPEPDLPRTSTGKVLRREVARRISAGEISVTPAVDRRAAELDLDSLARVQLQAQLEQQYGVRLDDTALQNVKTSEDVQQIVRRASTSPKVASTEARHIYPRWPWHPLQQTIRDVFLEVIAMPLVRLLAKPATRDNVQHWPGSPLLIVANHVTSYDAAFVLFALPGQVRRKVAVAMSGEMLLDFRRGRNQGNWFLNLLGPAAYFLMTALFNVFPLPQFSGFRESFRHAGEAVDRGYSILVFPEGRRSDDGAPQPFKSGAGLLWKDLGVPALAVHLAGLGELKAKRERWFRSGKIEVTIGPVLRSEPSRSPEQLTEELRESVFGVEPRASTR